MNENVHDEIVETFGAGKVLSRTFSVFFGNFVRFMALALLVYSPYFMMLLVQEHMQISAGGRLVSATLPFVLSYLVTASMIYGVFQQLGGENVSLPDCMSVAAGRLLPVLLVAIIVTIATGIGFILLIIPGILVYLGLFVAVPVVVVEGAGVQQAIDRSRKLTHGRRGAIFLSLIVVFAIGSAVSLVGHGITMTFEKPGIGLASAVINTVTSAFTTAFQAVMAAVTYHDLRVEKEGVGLEDLMQVFE